MLPHHHRVRRSSILTPDTIEFLTSHPTTPSPTALPTSHKDGIAVAGRRQTMRRQSMVPASRRFSVQQLLVQPLTQETVQPAQKRGTMRRLSLQPLTSSSPDLKILNTKVAESSYKRERRASLAIMQPHVEVKPESSLVRSFGFRGMSSRSSSSFVLGSSDSWSKSPHEGEVIDSNATTEGIKTRRKSSLWNSIWGKHLP